MTGSRQRMYSITSSYNKQQMFGIESQEELLFNAFWFIAASLISFQIHIKLLDYKLYDSQQTWSIRYDQITGGVLASTLLMIYPYTLQFYLHVAKAELQVHSQETHKQHVCTRHTSFTLKLSCTEPLDLCRTIIHIPAMVLRFCVVWLSKNLSYQGLYSISKQVTQTKPYQHFTKCDQIWQNCLIHAQFQDTLFTAICQLHQRTKSTWV